MKQLTEVHKEKLRNKVKQFNEIINLLNKSKSDDIICSLGAQINSFVRLVENIENEIK